MKCLLPYFACLATALAQTAPPPPVLEQVPDPQELEPKTESRSRQFVVYGSDFATRAAIASLAEETRDNLLTEAGADREWKNSIVIQLHGAQGDPAPARTMWSQTFVIPGGFRLQMDLHLAKGKPRDLERGILELLLFERGLRDKGEEQLETVLTVPPWLLDGLLESFRWRQGERDHELYTALFEKNQLFPVKRLLEIEDPGDMDGMTRSAFRASSGALVMSLLGQTGGKAAFNSLLSEVATFEGDEMVLLMKHFPGMNLGPESFSKWWALQLANMSDRPFLKVLTILETEEELAKLLVVRFRDAAGSHYEVPPEKFRDLLALPLEQRREALLPVVEHVGKFLYGAFPAHRPIIAEYLRILGEISNDLDEEIERRIEELAVQRGELKALGERTRDYLDWFRISSAESLSGDFESFMELKGGLQESTERRRGPVSEYLDDMQRIYEEK